ncbi:MAG: AAA family ATPase [Deltaproteobacteria bacterium]|jgi:hypothetical protein|nr:AAA family ATPase [Deltaproteobacteria bacterium]
MKKLPLGIADFPTIIQQNYIYADKTRLIYQLLTEKKSYFLSRPHRFGKSLLLSTINSILEGDRKLFKGLWIDSTHYVWRRNPVIFLKLGRVETHTVKQVEISLVRQIHAISKAHGLVLQYDTPANLFKYLFEELYNKYNLNVALLIDGYDAPIFKQSVDLKLANDIWETMEKFYGVLNNVEQLRGFTFVTGVFKLAYSSIFSSIKGIIDLTLNRNYSNICGFTKNEFNGLFPEHLEKMLGVFKTQKILPEHSTIFDLRQLVMDWYDGYTWDGVTNILNPLTILKFFHSKSIVQNPTLDDASPNLLKNLILKGGEFGFQNIDIEKKIDPQTNVIELGPNLKPIPFLFQAGYLTVTKVKKQGIPEYVLDYPNLEVKLRILPLLITQKPIQNPKKAWKFCNNMMESILKLDVTGFKKFFKKFLSLFPQKDLKPQELFYYELFQSAMMIGGGSIETNGYDNDFLVDTQYILKDGTEYLFDIKYSLQDLNLAKEISDALLKKDMENNVLKAVKQIKSKKYEEHYRRLGPQLFSIAIAVGGFREVMAFIEKG